jgi:predicted nucleic acid-binding protein
VSEAWVVNASPLILFSRIARLDLIERLAPAILVPDAVIEEVRVGEHKDRTAATAARRCAVAHHVSVIGTLGVVLRSKTNHQIENARPLVEELIAAGMFLDDEFVDRVLASIGE